MGESEEHMKQIYFAIQGAVAAFIAWLSAKLGILLPVMCVLMGMMIIDYITGDAGKQAGIVGASR